MRLMTSDGIGVEVDTPMEMFELIMLVLEHERKLKSVETAQKQRRPTGRRRPNRFKRWTAAEEAYMLKAMKTSSVREVAKTLGRSWRGVYNRHWRLTNKSDA